MNIKQIGIILLFICFFIELPSMLFAYRGYDKIKRIRAELYNLPPYVTPDNNTEIFVGGDDIVSYRCNVKLGEGKWTGWTVEISTKYPIILEDLPDGNHTIYVIGKNSDNEWQKLIDVTFFEWTIDSDEPIAVLNNLPNKIDSMKEIQINVTGIDIVEYVYNLNYNNTGWTGWSKPKKVEETLILSDLKDGYYKLKVLGKDSKDHWQFIYNSTNYEWSIESSDVIGKFEINNGENYTKSNKVVLNMEKVKNAISVAFSNTLEELEERELEKFSETKNWELPEGEGKKIVYAVFTNSLGKRFYMQESINLGEEPTLNEENPFLIDDYIDDAYNDNNITDLIESIKDGDIDNISEMINQHIEKKEYEPANDICEKVKELVRENDEWNLDLTDFDKIQEGIELLKQAEESIEEKDFDKAIEKYDELHKLVTENELEEVIPTEYIDTLKEKTITASELFEKIDEADELYEKEKYSDSKPLYEEVIKVVEQKELSDIIPVEDIIMKLKSIDDKLNFDYDKDDGNTIIKHDNLSLLPILLNMMIIHINDKDYDSAAKVCLEVIELIKKEEQNDLDYTVSNMENVYEILNSLVESQMDISNKDFDKAIITYEQILDKIKEEELSELIPEEVIEAYIKKLKKAKEVYKLIQKADSYYEKEKYLNARFEYQDALDETESENLEDVIPVEHIEDRLDSIPDLIKKFYINADFGILGNLSNLEYFTLTWNVAFNYRLSRLIGIGIGLDMFAIDTFVKLSVFNTTFRERVSSELIFKLSFFTNVLSYFGLGGGLSLDYVLGFNGIFGVYTGFGLKSMYYFKYSDKINMNIYFKIGAVINF